MKDTETTQTPELTCDPQSIADHLKTDIAALEKDAGALPPLLGFALNSMRGALNTINGHLGAVKKTAALLLLLALLCLPAHAQIFFGGSNIVGTATMPVLLNFQPQTNYASSYLVGRTLVIQNLVSNETATATYAYAAPGISNLYVTATLTTNFNGAGLTNGSTVYITVPAGLNLVPLSPWGTFTCTNAAGNVTNIVTFQ